MPSRNIATNDFIGYLNNSGSVSPVYFQKTFEESVLGAGIGGHYGYPRFPPMTDVGGDFDLSQHTIQRWGDIGQIQRNLTPGTTYSGQFLGQISDPGFSMPSVPLGDGSAWGVDAYNKMKPTKPNFNALTALLELRDMPHLLKMNLKQNFLQFESNYFLAIKFGWEPFLRDVKNLVKTQMSAQKRLGQLIRDNDKSIHRTRVMLDQSDIIREASGAAYSAIRPTLVTQFYKAIPRFRTTVRSVDKVWASGRFRYHLPPGPRDIVWKRKMLAKINGVYASPSQIYNAVPWTWLGDWFFNLGNALENAEPGVADRLAADYYYVMRYHGTTRDTTTTGYFYQPKTNAPVTYMGYAHEKSVRKTRVRGDPFGLGTTQESLSGTQLAILGALGLSRIG